MTSENKRLVMDRHRALLEEFPVEFVIEEDDLVTIVHHELRGEGDDEHDYFGFRTCRIKDGKVVEEWSNDAVGSAAPGGGRPQPARPAVTVGDGDPAVNKPRVADFYRRVFDAQNPEAVKDFVSEDYRQQSRHLPSGRAGLEALVAAAFPDGPIATPDEASIPPSILMGAGDLVVVAAGLPQPDGQGGTYLRYLYDAYRLRDGFLCEHWGGVDPHNRPVRP